MYSVLYKQGKQLPGSQCSSLNFKFTPSCTSHFATWHAGQSQPNRSSGASCEVEVPCLRFQRGRSQKRGLGIGYGTAPNSTSDLAACRRGLDLTFFCLSAFEIIIIRPKTVIKYGLRPHLAKRYRYQQIQEIHRKEISDCIIHTASL